MGIVYNSKVGKGYINSLPCRQTVSRHRAFKVLTRRNIQFLRSLGLKVVLGKN